jgi:tetratricopeptide (TPR) repeat protein
MAALLSRLVRDQGRDLEALELSKAAEATAAEDDVDTQALWRLIRAPMLARSGKDDDAEGLARSALEFAMKTDSPTLRADALFALAEVLELGGRRDAAKEQIRAAMDLYTSKGDQASLERSKAWAQKLSG